MSVVIDVNIYYRDIPTLRIRYNILVFKYNYHNNDQSRNRIQDRPVPFRGTTLLFYFWNVYYADEFILN